MQRQMLKSKIHRATVTACDVDYVGSVTIDAELMRQADLLPNEQVHLWDLENDTYSPIVVHVDDRNRMTGIDSNPEVLLAGTGETSFGDEVPGALGTGTATAGSLS